MALVHFPVAAVIVAVAVVVLRHWESALLVPEAVAAAAVGDTARELRSVANTVIGHAKSCSGK